MAGLFVLASSIGCGGSLSPLYADFRIEDPPPGVVFDSTGIAGDSLGAAPDSVDVALADTLTTPTTPTTPITPTTRTIQSIQDRIADALLAAGWELDEAPSENAVSTKEVEIAEWGLYDVRVSLDVIPINDKFVRVYVHPYRQYFYGSRSKMSYMNRRVREYVFPELAEAFRARGIVPLEAPAAGEQDEEAGHEEDDSQETVSASGGAGR